MESVKSLKAVRPKGHMNRTMNAFMPASQSDSNFS